MYSAIRQIIVNGLPVDINLSTVQDPEGTSLIATFTSPMTGKSYALFEKLTAGDGPPEEQTVEVKIEESMDSICLRACRALFEREAIVTHVLYKDYLLSRSREETAVSGGSETSLDINNEDREKIDKIVADFLRIVEKHRKFEEYLKRSGLA
jgi:hypothetical protein